MTDELIKRACSTAMKAHRSAGKYYLQDKIRGSPEVVFGFAGSWSANDLFRDDSYGETNISRQLFPSMRSIGNDETAKVNKAFAERFEDILQTLKNEVEKNIKKGKQIAFAGHSSGGPIAIFATLWFLEKYSRAVGVQIPCRCVTFGSPLTGDKIFGHAITRENWSRYFVHFVMKYDIVPRIMLAPRLAMENELQKVLNFFKNLKFPISQNEVIANEAHAFFMNVMRNASSVTSHAACNLMGCTNMLLETFSNFIKLSPYRPFGTYIFCSTNGKLVVVENPDAVLQMLFYCSQLSNEGEGVEIAIRSLNEHMLYEKELQESLEMQTVICLDHLEKLPLSSVGNTLDEVTTVNTALNDLGLSTRARLCLRAAGELEEQKIKNQSRIDSNKTIIVKALHKIEAYQKGCEVLGTNYYDAFKLQNDPKDFNTNVSRLELAGIWDEIIELLKRYELPDGFESCTEWIQLGTKFRQLVEPLDVANYYRHLKNDDTGPYLIKGRPRRYRYTQRWHEHASRMQVESSSGSCFWAEVEELQNKRFEDIKEKLEGLETNVLKWISKGELGKDVFLDGSTFAEWWNTLPYQHRSTSCLAQHITR